MDDFLDILDAICCLVDVSEFVADFGGISFDTEDKGYFRPDTLYNKFDAANKDYEKNVYKELKALRFRGVLSNEEYKKLYEHQKAIDEKDALINDIKTRKFSTPKQAISGLNNYKNRVIKFYEKGYIANENFDKVINLINEKIDEIKRIEKI